MMDNNKFYDFLVSYLAFFESVLETEKFKFESLLKNDIDCIEKSIASKQAEIMKVKNLEDERLLIQSKIGFKDMKFSEILEKLSENDKKRFSEIFDKTSSVIYEIKFLNEKSESILKINLDRLNFIRKNIGTSESISYTKDKKTVKKSTESSLEKKV